MATQELFHVMRAVHLTDQTAVAGATQTSGTLDTLNFESAGIVWDVNVWAGAGSTWVFSLTESNVAGGPYTTVLDINQEWFLNGVQVGVGAASAPVVSSSATDRCTVAVSYVGGTMRYLRGVATLTGTPTTMILTPLGMLGRPREVGPKAFSNWSP